MCHAPPLAHLSYLIRADGWLWGPGLGPSLSTADMNIEISLNTCNIPYAMQCVLAVFHELFMELCRYGISRTNGYHIKGHIQNLHTKICCAAHHLLQVVGK